MKKRTHASARNNRKGYVVVYGSSGYHQKRGACNDNKQRKRGEGGKGRRTEYTKRTQGPYKGVRARKEFGGGGRGKKSNRSQQVQEEHATSESISEKMKTEKRTRTERDAERKQKRHSAGKSIQAVS